MSQKFAVITPIAMAVALLAGCGGGSSTPETKQPVAAFVGVTLTGTVATGAAMVHAKVEANCATGTGSADSAADGSYTLKIAGAALPCLLRATSADAATVLHSVADGTGPAAATVNITPVTELVVAKAVGSGGTPASAFGAHVTFTTAQLAEAKAAVIAALKSITDLTGIDPLSTVFRATAPGVVGDDTDKKLDDLTKALATAKLPLARLSNALVTTADASAALAAVTAVLSAPPLASCPSLRSGSYSIVLRRGHTSEAEFNLSTMRATEADGTVSTLESGTEACRFKLLNAQGVQRGELVLGAEGVGLFVSEVGGANGDRATALLLPKQQLTQASLAGDWTAVEWDRRGNGLLPRVGFGAVALAADGTATYQGCTQTAGKSDCTAADRKITGALTVKAGGKINVTVNIHPGVEVPGYAFRASNGSYLIAVGKPDGNGITLLTRSALSALPTVGTPRKVWEAFGTSTLDLPDTFVGRPISAFDVNFTSVDNATSALTAANGQILTLNKLLPGMFYRPAGSNGPNNWPEAIGLEVPGVLSVIGMNEASSASFGVSLLRP